MYFFSIKAMCICWKSIFAYWALVTCIVPKKKSRIKILFVNSSFSQITEGNVPLSSMVMIELSWNMYVTFDHYKPKESQLHKL